jgi:hypothetical protein
LRLENSNKYRHFACVPTFESSLRSFRRAVVKLRVRGSGSLWSMHDKAGPFVFVEPLYAARLKMVSTVAALKVAFSGKDRRGKICGESL